MNKQETILSRILDALLVACMFLKKKKNTPSVGQVVQYICSRIRNQELVSCWTFICTCDYKFRFHIFNLLCGNTLAHKSTVLHMLTHFAIGTFMFDFDVCAYKSYHFKA